jgi:uncharacterized cofD-like protein
MSSVRDRSFLKWLYPGMHVKRWLFLLLVGMAIMGLGVAYLFREAYLTYEFPGAVRYLTLQFIPRYLRGVMFMGGALLMVGIAVWKLNSSLISAFRDPQREESLVNVVYNSRFLKRGPRIVAIGGGTGLSMLLKGLKEYSGNLTGIVTVADDGGSSGRLREELGILAPGDLRRCITALADAEPLMTRLFEYRFREGSGLEGHSFGNLFIAAMTGVTGNFESAIRETSRVLAVRGQILPSTLNDVTLGAWTDEGEEIHGEHRITERGGRIQKVFLKPANAQAYPDATRAILDADMIVVGPGSLFTSSLPNLLVDGILRSLEASDALKVFVCNVATQHGETDDFSVEDHLLALERHAGRNLFHCVIANNNVENNFPEQWHSAPVRVGEPGGIFSHVRLVQADVVDEDVRYRHDPKKLADTLMRIYYERGQMLGTPTDQRETIAVGGG